MIGRKNATVYLGAVGQDDYATKLIEAAMNDGVTVRYHTVKDHPTGTCAVLVMDKERALIANLGAASHYDISHLQNKDIWEMIEKVKVYYSAGFFLTASPTSLIHIAKYACSENRIMAGNLAAPFICEHFYKQLMEAMPYYDILFGNESEAVAFGKKHGVISTEGKDPSVVDVIKTICQLPKANLKRPRIVVITCGIFPTVVAINGEYKEYLVELVDRAKIVDTNGAGDAFVGGFLSVLVDPTVNLEGAIDDAIIQRAVLAGHWSAGQIIQVSGIVIKGQAKKF